MHILLVSFDFCLEAGGIQNTSFLLAEHLSNYADITCFSCSDGHDICIDKVEFVKSKYELNKFKRYHCGILHELRSIHAKKKIDYVLCVHRAVSRNIAIFRKVYSVPMGIMVHGNEIMSPHISFTKNIVSGLKGLASRCAIKMDLIMSSDIFANSQYTKNLVYKICNHKSVSIIHPPISLVPSGKCENYKAHTLFSVGRLVERKGFQNVIKALPIVIKEIHDLRYILSGGGTLEDTLKKLAKTLGLENHVIFTGSISEMEKQRFYRECGLFIMPSFIIPEECTVEGFGIVYVEANAYGKYVIASNSGGIPDAVISGVTGSLIQENNVDAIASAILDFYKEDFKYDPQVCIDWASKNHISEIAYLYYEKICNKLGFNVLPKV